MWQRGPVPPDTIGYGAVVLFSEHGGQEDKFHFAEFKGDSVLIVPGETSVSTTNVALYNNSLDLPSGVIKRG